MFIGNIYSFPAMPTFMVNRERQGIELRLEIKNVKALIMLL